MVAAENNAARSPRVTPDLTSVEEGQILRGQISLTLGSKDPSWFKQTADRGTGSAAYRRSQEDTASAMESVAGKRQLPGMTRGSSTSIHGGPSPSPETMHSGPPPTAGSLQESVTSRDSRCSRDTSAAGSSTLEGKSPLPTLNAQKLEPPAADNAPSTDDGDQSGSARTLAMSPSQGRISPERTDRPPSPTKGMGGFVQSAMLKRSDSMSKRWSVQASPGLSRQNSTASARNGLAGSMSMPRLDSKPGSLSRENSLKLSSRLNSSHSNATVTPDAGGKPEWTAEGEHVKPASSHHGRAKSVTALYTSSIAEDHESTDTSPPPSPSKRWSPTKSSWLESALQKPESPKLRVQAITQPSWMAEINKAKQQKETARSDSIASSIRATPPLKVTQARLNKPQVTQGPSVQIPKARPSVSSAKSLEKSDEVAIPAEDSSDSSDSRGTSGVEAHIFTAQQAFSAPKEPTQTPKSAPPSISARPRPETPPKKDFRSALKPRQEQAAAPPKEELEFKNVFGKLKRTQTERYVAPDELKNNILRGKSGLALTNGPQKAQREDELKDSLLKRKESIKAKAAEESKPVGASSNGFAQSPAVSGALAMKEFPTRSYNSAKAMIGSQGGEPLVPEAIARQKSFKEKPKFSLPRKQLNASEETPFGEPTASSKLADRFNPALAGVLARGSSALVGGAVKPKATGQAEANNHGLQYGSDGANEIPPGQLVHKTKGRARGPKRRAPTAKIEDIGSHGLTAVAVTTVPLVKTKDVLHSTPSRVTSASYAAPVAASKQRPLTPAKVLPESQPETPAKSPVLVGRKVSSQRKLEQPQPRKPSSSLKDLLAERSQAAQGSVEEPLESPPQLHRSPQDISNPSAGLSKQQPLPNTTPAEAATTLHEESLRADESPSLFVRNAAALWGRQPGTTPPLLSQSKAPIKLPTRADEQAAIENAGLSLRATPPKQPVGLGLGLTGNEASQLPNDTQTDEPTLPHKYSMSPPLSAGLPPKPAKKPDHIASMEPSAFIKTPLSPIPHTSEASRLIAEFFNEPPTTINKAAIDTQTILTSSLLDTGKIKTLRKHMQEISGDGKPTAVPAPEEHILFEDSMYICTHVFGDAKGAKTTEVYIWAGSGVPEPTLENIQLFGRKVAKEQNGKLIILRQGKETPNFFQALGGIVITRRGTRQTNDSFAVKPKSYMLCCRRHMGHIAFDEVELSASSMCSGFSYIISSHSGRLFLWKGVGCNAEELGCARLISMDLGVTGEVEEVDEGHEPPALLDALSSNTIPRSADHWRLKATCPNYNVRLFRVDQVQQQQLLQVSSFWPLLVRRPSWSKLNVTSPTSPPQTPDTPQSQTKIVEIAPFSQTDIEAECIYVLDAFFEVYM